MPMGMVMAESVVLVVGCSRNSWRYTTALRVMSPPQQMDRQLGGPKQIRHKLISNKQWHNGNAVLFGVTPMQIGHSPHQNRRDGEYKLK